MGGGATAVPSAAEYWYLIEDVERKVNDLLNIRDIQPELVDHLTRFGSVDFDFLRNWSHVLAPYVERGVPTDPVGLKRWRAVRETWRDSYRLEFATFVQKYASQPGNFLALRSGITESSRTREYWSVNPLSLIAQMLDSGRFAYISGPPDRGKTDTYGLMCKHACDAWTQYEAMRKGSQLEEVVRSVRRENASAAEALAEAGADDEMDSEEERTAVPELGMLGAKGFSIVDNVKWGPGPYEKFHTYSARLSETLCILAKNTIDEKFTWWGMDELARNMPKALRQRRENRWLEGTWRTVRKSRCAAWFMSQGDEDLVSTFRKWCQTEIQKVRRSVALFKVDGVYTYLRLRSIPSFRRWGSFNTQGFGTFTVDINGEKLGTFIGDVEAGVDFGDPKKAIRLVNEAVIEWCSDPKNRVDYENPRSDPE